MAALAGMNADVTQRRPDDVFVVRSRGRLRELANLTEKEAADLVNSALEASRDQVLETMGGLGPVPSSMTAARAELLYFMCLRAKRVLVQREIEVIFRMVPSAARTILATMRATYEEAIRNELIKRMREGATVQEGGTVDTALTWKIKFRDRADLQTALEELTRLGLISDANQLTNLSIELPREVRKDKQARRPLEALGIPPP